MSTSFTMDKQTLEELNLLGKFRNGSVYGLFGNTRTRGGERLLDDMFRRPLADADAINDRSAVFQHFQRADLKFPFDVQQVILMREYLDTRTGKYPVLVYANTVVKRMLSSLVGDEQFKRNIQGLQATILLLNKCFDFVQKNDFQGCSFGMRSTEIKKILSEKAIEKIRNTNIYKDLTSRTIAFFDTVLKGKLYPQMESILSFVYETDVNIAVSEVAGRRGFCYAKALPEKANIFSVTDVFHPCVSNAVGNSIELGRDQNVLFLTGANMAGKSTLMKAIGVSLYLAHMGFPVAAGRMEFSVREGLYSSINVADNIGMGYSHFYAEVVRVKRAAEAAAKGRRLLLMFDELFKGTNVKDAFDGTLAVTEGFSEYRNCLFIVSTHIIEVGEALKGRSNIRFGYMPTVMDGLHPLYTYKMKEGITEDRQGMMIIRDEGILDLLNS
ncbi:DNA mismatch repair protein [Flavitalea sp. BT771]|uniref:MutS-related protein n=1 Tax=Flavitalea sp. BT771 TaxID=3063329 RepID=UPI0026E2D886|nr:DNA mismatch repair protein [Flavitalea sp. BT771]MDO6430066.1 DNA mismatch repair protein [Flavitalea sp. BT771]MDV6219795.1 DNA mismatch repair protein [Flavitalea sp. BT771]